MQNNPAHHLNIGRYIDPVTDYGFKLLFGSEPNKDLLISFLNELLRGRKIIVDLVYNKNEYKGPQAAFRTSIFDLSCTDQDGAQFIIEIQRSSQRFFKDRAIYYTSSLIHDQGPKGKSNWDFRLNEVYLVALMDFGFRESFPESYLHRIHLADETTGKVFYEKLSYIFIEIPKFSKEAKYLKTGLDRWLYLLKNLGKFEKIPVFLNTVIFRKLFKIAEISKLTKEEYMKYEKSLMAKWDEYAILETAKEKGIEEGIEKGFEKGIEKGKTDVVRNLLIKMNLSDVQAAEVAEVPVNFVKKVRRSLKK